MIKDFVSFLTKANALALAIGVIIGGATGKLVSSVVDDFLMPVIGLVMPAGDWRAAQVVLSQSTDPLGKTTVNAVKYGHLLGSVLDFMIIAFVVYVLTKALLPKDPAPAATKTCPECLEIIPAAAHKCRACTAVI